MYVQWNIEKSWKVSIYWTVECVVRSASIHQWSDVITSRWNPREREHRQRHPMPDRTDRVYLLDDDAYIIWLSDQIVTIIVVQIISELRQYISYKESQKKDFLRGEHKQGRVTHCRRTVAQIPSVFVRYANRVSLAKSSNSTLQVKTKPCCKYENSESAVQHPNRVLCRNL